jgi:hypothetical protein
MAGKIFSKKMRWAGWVLEGENRAAEWFMVFARYTCRAEH